MVCHIFLAVLFGFVEKKLPNALITGTDRTLHVAVTKAPHFLANCVKTQPTGEQPSWTRTLENKEN